METALTCLAILPAATVKIKLSCRSLALPMVNFAHEILKNLLGKQVCFVLFQSFKTLNYQFLKTQKGGLTVT